MGISSDIGGLRLHVLASGSKGNASIIQNSRTGEGILVDCGICKRDFLERCGQVGFDPRQLKAVLITHEHTDHTKGLGPVLRSLAKMDVRCAFYCAPEVRAASGPVTEVLDQGLCDSRSFKAGDALKAAAVEIQVFPTSHDAAASFGFRFEGEGDAVGFMTDSGQVTPQAHEALADVRILALEANHDLRMLDEAPYPYAVKRRIASEWGHLSNDQAAEELASLLSGRLQGVVAMHISQNSNDYRKPREVLQGVLDREGHGAAVLAAYQDRVVSL